MSAAVRAVATIIVAVTSAGLSVISLLLGRTRTGVATRILMASVTGNVFNPSGGASGEADGSPT